MPRPGPRARGYGSPWDRARAGFLSARPWCAWCVAQGKQARAVHVHHSERHGGDQRKFWDKSKWVPLCAEHHNRDAQQIEARGYSSRLDADGLPTDPAHPFNR